MSSGAAHGSTEYLEPVDGRVAVVAVIGAGASGTLATIYLLRAAVAARIPLRIALLDRHGQHGLGRAYATAHPAHLLNSSATSPATGRCTATVCRPRPLSGSTSSGRQDGSRCYAAAGPVRRDRAGRPGNRDSGWLADQRHRARRGRHRHHGPAAAEPAR